MVVRRDEGGGGFGGGGESRARGAAAAFLLLALASSGAAQGTKQPLWAVTEPTLGEDTGWGSPCVGPNGLVYQGDMSGRLVAVNAATGAVVWQRTLNGQLSGASPILNSTATRLYVASAWSPGRLFCLNPANGALLFTYQVPKPGYLSGPNGGEKIGGGHHGAAISRDDRTIYLGSGNWVECNDCSEDVVDDRFLAIDVSNDQPSLKWFFSTTQFEAEDSEERWSFFANPAIAPDGTIYVGTFNGYFYRFRDDGGSYTLLDRFDFHPFASPKADDEGIPPEVWGSAAIGCDGTVYVPTNDGRLWAFLPDLTPKWSGPLDANYGNPNDPSHWYENFASPVITSDGLIVSSDESGRIYGVRDDGPGTAPTRAWTKLFAGQWFRTPVVTGDGRLVVGSEKSGKYWALDAASGAVAWTTPNIGEETGCFPAVDDDGRIFVTGGYDGGLFAFQGDAPLASTPWPKGSKDLSNSGLADSVAPSSSVRNGSGSNPVGFVELSPAALGEAWRTRVVLGPGQNASALYVGLGGPTQGTFLGGGAEGEVLILPPFPIVDVSVGGIHALGVPADCVLLGASLSAQATAFTLGAGSFVLQNALDVTIGSP